MASPPQVQVWGEPAQNKNRHIRSTFHKASLSNSRCYWWHGLQCVLGIMKGGSRMNLQSWDSGIPTWGRTLSAVLVGGFLWFNNTESPCNIEKWSTLREAGSKGQSMGLGRMKSFGERCLCHICRLKALSLFLLSQPVIIMHPLSQNWVSSIRADSFLRRRSLASQAWPYLTLEAKKAFPICCLGTHPGEKLELSKISKWKTFL